MNQTYLDYRAPADAGCTTGIADDTFALKGGTAINLFVRDMPRLSVDLDLVFPDHTLPRDEALARITEAVRQAADAEEGGRGWYRAGRQQRGRPSGWRRGPVQVVKIEVNFVMRGTRRPVRVFAYADRADVLMADLVIPVVSLRTYGASWWRH